MLTLVVMAGQRRSVWSNCHPPHRSADADRILILRGLQPQLAASKHIGCAKERHCDTSAPRVDVTAAHLTVISQYSTVHELSPSSSCDQALARIDDHSNINLLLAHPG